MAKVIFSKYPKDTRVDVGKSLILKADALTKTGAEVYWEFLKDSGWKKIPKAISKTLNIKKTKAAHSGAYRCVINGSASRIAKVTVGEVVAPAKEKDLEPTIEPTKENGAFIEILESTGKDISPELLEKVIPAVIKELPDSLKGTDYFTTISVEGGKNFWHHRELIRYKYGKSKKLTESLEFIETKYKKLHSLLEPLEKDLK